MARLLTPAAFLVQAPLAIAQYAVAVVRFDTPVPRGQCLRFQQGRRPPEGPVVEVRLGLQIWSADSASKGCLMTSLGNRARFSTAANG